MGVSADDCQKRFKYLRDKYTKNNRNKKTGMGADEVESSPIYSCLSFLADHIKHRESSGNFHQRRKNSSDTELEQSVPGTCLENSIATYPQLIISSIPSSSPNTSILNSSHLNATSTPPGSSEPKPKRRKKEMEEFLLKELEATNNLLKEKPTENELFGQFVAKALDNIEDKKVQSDLRLHIMSIIHDSQYM